MKLLVKNHLLILIPQDDDEQAILAAWKEGHRGHLLHVAPNPGTGLALHDLGPRGHTLAGPPAGPAPDPLPEDGRVLFYRRDRRRFGFLSNFAPAPLLLEGETWPTVEHYYQAQKSADRAYQEAIRAAATPGQAKDLGTWLDPAEFQAAPPESQARLAARSWFLRHRAAPRPDWDAVKLAVMREAVRAKFGQNPDLARQLLATATAELIEDSKSDAYWGVGRDGRGQNWLGRILMDVREALRGPT